MTDDTALFHALIKDMFLYTVHFRLRSLSVILLQREHISSRLFQAYVRKVSFTSILGSSVTWDVFLCDEM